MGDPTVYVCSMNDAACNEVPLSRRCTDCPVPRPPMRVPANTTPKDSSAAGQELEAIVKFLCGEAPLDDHWFDDQSHPNGSFWWRAKLRAALAQRDAGEVPVAQAFWVVERFEDGRSAGYWDGANSRSFQADIAAAVQFCRQQDATRATRGWHWTDTKVVEHAYIGTHPAPAGEPREVTAKEHDVLLAAHRRSTKVVHGGKLAPREPLLEGLTDEAIYEAVREAMRNHRMTYTLQDDDEGSGLPLVDMVNPEGDKDITRGLVELDYLAGEIAAGVAVLSASAPPQPVQAPVGGGWQPQPRVTLVEAPGDALLTRTDFGPLWQHAMKLAQRLPGIDGHDLQHTLRRLADAHGATA
jgi:hypothetical protein